MRTFSFTRRGKDEKEGWDHVSGGSFHWGSCGSIWAHRENRLLRRIEWKDERNRQIRHYAGYLTYAVTMLGCFVAAVAANLLGASNRIVFILLAAGAAEGVLFTVFEWYARRKTEA